MRTFLLSLGLILISVLSALWVGPYFVDWSDHRASFSQALTKLTNRQIEVRGNLVVRLLPTPAIRVWDVSIGAPLTAEQNQPGTGKTNASRLKRSGTTDPAGSASNNGALVAANDGSDGNGSASDPASNTLLQFDSLTMRLDFGSLLRGKFYATAITVNRPRLNLITYADGSENWHVPLNGDNPSAFFNSAQVDNMTVIDGTIVVEDHREGESYTLEKIRGRISATSLDGPYTASGTMAFAPSPDRKLSFSLGIGEIRDQRAEVNLVTHFANGNLEASLRGDVDLTSKQTRFEGAITVDADAGISERLIGIAAPTQWGQQRLVVRSNLTYRDRSAAFDELEWSIPWGTMRGYAHYDRRESYLTVGLKAHRLAEGVRSATNAGVRSETGDGEHSNDAQSLVLSATTSAAAAQSHESTVDVFAMGYQGLIELLEGGLGGRVKVEVASLGRGTSAITNLQLDAEIHDDRITMHNLSARLPGQSRNRFSGALVRDERNFRIWRGKLVGESQIPARLVNWVSADSDPLLEGLSLSEIGGVDYSADIEWSDYALRINALKIDQGKQSVTGRVAMALQGERFANVDLTTRFLEWTNEQPRPAKAPTAPKNATNSPSGSGSENDIPQPEIVRALLRSNKELENARNAEKQAAQKAAGESGAGSDAAGGDTAFDTPLPPQPSLGMRLANAFAHVRRRIDGTPMRLTLSSDTVGIGGVKMSGLRLIAKFDGDEVRLDKLTVRGKGGLAVQVSGDLAFDEGIPLFRIQGTATGSDTAGAADLLRLAGISQRVADEVGQWPAAGIAPFSLLAQWQQHGSTEARISAAGTVGTAEFTYSVSLPSDDKSAITGFEQSERTISLSHPDLKAWLKRWDVAPPESLPDRQEFTVHLILPPRANDTDQQLVASIRSGETQADLTANAVWNDDYTFVPHSLSGQLSARGDDPRWWLGVMAPWLASQLEGEASHVALPYSMLCKVQYSKHVLNGEECAARAANSRIRGNFVARTDGLFAERQTTSAASDTNADDHAIKLRANLDIDGLSLQNLWFEPLSDDGNGTVAEANQPSAGAGDVVTGSTTSGDGELPPLPRLPNVATLQIDGDTFIRPTLAAVDATVETAGLTWRSEPWKGSVNADGSIIANVTVGNLTIAGDMAFSDVKAMLSISDGKVRVSDFNGTWRDGPVRGAGEIAVAEGLVLLNTEFSAAPKQVYQLDARDAAGARVSISGEISAKGSVRSAGTSMQSLVSAASGSGEVRITDAHVTGLASQNLESAYFAALNASTLDVFDAAQPFGPLRVQVGSVAGKWSATDGAIRFSAPASGKSVERLSAVYGIADLRRQVSMRFAFDDPGLKPYDVTVSDVGPAFTSRASPMQAKVNFDALRQQLTVKITEDSVFDLSELAEYTEDPEDGPQPERIRIPTEAGTVAVETLSSPSPSTPATASQ